MPLLQTAISIICVILTFVGYVPYLHDVIKKKTTPHAFTWFIWTLAGYIGWGLQVVGRAGVGAWTLFSASTICFVIFLFSLRNGKKDIKFSDVVFLVLSIISLYLWIVFHHPILSVILITLVEILGFVPTVRKSWNNPYSETLFTYELCVFRHALSIAAFQSFNVLTLLYPIAWVAANLAFTIILITRRKVIGKVHAL